MTANGDDFNLMVPTYHYQLHGEQVERGELPEYGEPLMPVLIHEAMGVRIVLGTHDYHDDSKPDIQIERQPNGWAIFLHPTGGGDASGIVYFLDDGRSFVVHDNNLRSHGNIEFLEYGVPVPDIDGPQRAQPLPLLDVKPTWIVNEETP